MNLLLVSERVCLLEGPGAPSDRLEDILEVYAHLLRGGHVPNLFKPAHLLDEL